MNRPFRVQQGNCHVNSVFVHRWTKDAFAIEVDFRAKYPAFMVGYGSDGDVKISVYPDKSTMRVDPGDEMTKIIIPGKARGWVIEAGMGRYTLTVVGVRESDRFGHPFNWYDE